jgi:glyoxylase-like metal-dependent hydrolase (beta-lactamase superfamily II)
MALRFDRTLETPYGEAISLSPHIARVLAPNPGPFTYKGTGVYLVGAGKRIAVIDPGPDLPHHVEALKRAIGTREISHILITHTHRDHSPAAAALKEWSGAKTYAAGPHSAQTGEVEEGADRDFHPDVIVKDDEVIAGDGFTLTCVATPGHTANHMCYALQEEQALFSGDHVMGWSTSVVAPPDGDMAAYLASLERLIARGDRILYPTHGSPITAPQEYLRELRAHRMMREAQILQSLRPGADTAKALAATLYPDIDLKLAAAAASQVQAHLEHLEKKGALTALPGARYARVSR